jgi:hypothetical protein
MPPNTIHEPTTASPVTIFVELTFTVPVTLGVVDTGGIVNEPLQIVEDG